MVWAFASNANADNFVARLAPSIAPVGVEPKVRQVSGLFRVFVGPYASRDDAKRIADRLRDALREVPRRVGVWSSGTVPRGEPPGAAVEHLAALTAKPLPRRVRATARPADDSEPTPTVPAESLADRALMAALGALHGGSLVGPCRKVKRASGGR